MNMDISLKSGLNDLTVKFTLTFKLAFVTTRLF